MLPKQLKDSQRHQRQPKQVELFLQRITALLPCEGKSCVTLSGERVTHDSLLERMCLTLAWFESFTLNNPNIDSSINFNVHSWIYWSLHKQMPCYLWRVLPHLETLGAGGRCIAKFWTWKKLNWLSGVLLPLPSLRLWIWKWMLKNVFPDSQ